MTRCPLLTLLVLATTALWAQDDSTTMQATDTAAMADATSEADAAAAEAEAQAELFEHGEAVFRANCASCHAMGMKMTGPDLTGILSRRDESWVRNFIVASQSMIKEGDPDAVALWDEYKTVMPDHPHLTDEDLDGLIAYVDAGGEKKELPKEVVDITKTGTTVITDPRQSIIDLPFVRMVFWGSVLVILGVFINFSFIASKLTKNS